ncbi:vicilin Jug r 2.0101-like [Aristolochia californica]|uniref:vicilin Jug r 2.0101-like n=1 Tax=Aristolochia californica TaxID=171875 RepID=UPI0035DB7A24
MALFLAALPAFLDKMRMNPYSVAREAPVWRRGYACGRLPLNSSAWRDRQQRPQDQQHQCLEECQLRYREQERGWGEGVPIGNQDPEEQLQRCKQDCREQAQQHGRRETEQRRECERWCEERYEKQRGQEQDNPERESEQEGRNPYHFREERYRERIRTEHGYVKVLDEFTKQSELLRGVENYRVSLMEANPQTFEMPAHFDAEGIFYVNRGRGTITLLQEENKQTYNLEQGDIIT